MLQCVSRSCLRNGRSIVDYVVRYGSTQTARGLSSLASCNTVRAPRSWSVHPVTDIRQRAFTGSVSLQSSRRIRDAPEPPAAPSRTGRAGNDLGGEDFGSLSADFSSRRAFRKTTPELQEMLYREERQAAGQEEEREPVAFRSKTGRRNTQYWYFLQCKRLIKENKLSEALSMFQSEMLEGERLQPEEYNYTQAIHLEQELRRKNHPLSDITYHALLKTHALTNHLRACLHTLRDMLQAGDPAVASALLLTSDCGQGGQAVKVMGQGSAPLDVDALESQLFTQHPDNGLSHHSNRFGHHSNDPSHHSNDLSDHSNDPSHHSIDPSHHSDLNSSVVVPVTTQLVMVRKGGEQEAPIGSLPCLSAASTRPPNLLDLSVGRAGEGCVVSLGAVSGAFDRLALMGGAQGFLDKMATAGLCPDIRTLTLLADIMEPGSQSLHSLLAVAKQHGVKLDAAFYNSVFSALIGCASRRLDYVYLRVMLRAMREHNVPPNEIIIIQLEHASQYPPNYNQETGGPERDHPTETRQDGHQQAAVAARRYRKQHS
ncbi:unnamed protein product [Coregonus sp. 'balchen']|nr:unnamed protein product [Coregonus sp. 'balchen']